MKRLTNIFWIFIPFILGILFIILDITYVCPFNYYFHIPCPGCGMTRAFKLILQGNILASLQYNLLAIPLFIFIILSMIFLVVDIIKNQTKYLAYIERISQKYGVWIILAVLIVWMCNIIINGERL